MKKELQLRSKEWEESLKSIYFGGGTPSILDPLEFTSLFKEIERNFDLSQVDEVTLECNPEDLSDKKLAAWKAMGVNRLSIGNQSFQDPILKTINRQHSSEIAIRGIKRARDYSFDSISIDVIMGLPGLTSALLEADLKKLMELEPEHISAYQLSVENKTTLAHQLKNGTLKIASDEEVNDQFLLVDDFLRREGYAHYEISNYAKPGFEAKHNAAYWSGATYLGIGPGAHSFTGNTRRWNVSNNGLYMKNITENKDCFETEQLTEKDRFNEAIMIALRTRKGLDLNALQKAFPDLYSKEMEEQIAHWIKEKWASKADDNVQLSLEGWLISDSLASDLFVL